MNSSWEAGVASIDITPQVPIQLAGYGRRRISSEVIQPIYAKALALKDETGAVSVLVTTDLLGYTRAMAIDIAERVERQYGIARERLILNSSHNHSCPTTTNLLPLYYELDEAELATVDTYTNSVIENIVQAVGEALATLAPAEIAFEQGLAGFAVNRRRSRPGTRPLPGPVDHDVPVLRVTGADGSLRAIVFGYACHTTSLAGDELNGDYAGWAAAELEAAHPGAVALFVAGCGGDQNPLPRYTIAISKAYGSILAAAVENVLAVEMLPVSGPLSVAWHEAELFIGEPPTRAELEAQLEGTTGIRRREVEFQLAVLDRGEELQKSCAYPVQVWRFGNDLLFISLSGEPVVDFSLRFKERYGWDTTWVSGYSNELLSYIPSQRVLLEGGYEGTVGMMEYELPAPYRSDVEEIIAETVDHLARKTAGHKVAV